MRTLADVCSHLLAFTAGLFCTPDWMTVPESLWSRERESERMREGKQASVSTCGEGHSESLKFLAPPNGPRSTVIAPTELGINGSTARGRVISEVSVTLVVLRSEPACLDGNVCENHRGVDCLASEMSSSKEIHAALKTAKPAVVSMQLAASRKQARHECVLKKRTCMDLS